MNNVNDLLSNYTAEELNLLAATLDNIRSSSNIHQHSIGNFADEYLRYSKSYHAKKYTESIKLSFDHLLFFLAKDYLIDEINIATVTDFLDHIRKAAPKGYRVYFRNLKAAFNKAAEWEYIKTNPFAKVKLPKQQKAHPTFITRSELSHVLKHVPNKIIYAIILFSFLTGCRLSEAVNLQYSNIDFTKRLLTIGSDQFQTKTRDQRIIPICNELFELLSELFNQKVGKSNFVFPKENGFPYSADYVSKKFKEAVRKAGVDEKLHFHSLRHSFASNLVQQEVPIYTVQKLLGHSSVTTTEIYSHLNTSELENAINKLNNNKLEV